MQQPQWMGASDRSANARGWWAKVALTSLALAGCGGATRDNPADAMSTPTAGSAQAGSAGNPGSGGNGAAGETSSWLADLKLDDSFPWFVGGPGQQLGATHWPDAEAPAQVLHVVLEGAPVEAIISTHNHFDVLHHAERVKFEARATTEVSVLVSVRATLDGDYYAARDAGHSWPVAPAELGPDWQAYDVAFADMLPAETAEPSAVPAFMIAFVVEHPTGPLELWFDNVHFE